MNKKTIFIIIIVLLIPCFILFFIKLKNYKLLNEMYELCNDINNYDNVHILNISTCNYSEEVSITDFYRKGNIEISKTREATNTEITYINSETNMKIYVRKDEDIKEVSVNNNYYQEESLYNMIPLLNKTPSGDLEFEQWKYEKYIYKGIENINGQDCYKIIIKHQSSDPETQDIYWIGQDNGLLLKKESIATTLNTNDKQITTNIYFYEFNYVIDDDIEMPDLKEYEASEYEIIYE